MTDLETDLFHHWLDPVWQAGYITGLIGTCIFAWRYYLDHSPRHDSLMLIGMGMLSVGGLVGMYGYKEASKHHPTP